MWKSMESDKVDLQFTQIQKLQNIKATPVIPIQQILHRIDIHRETQENIRKQTVCILGNLDFTFNNTHILWTFFTVGIG